jgi:hypothetical protein
MAIREQAGSAISPLFPASSASAPSGKGTSRPRPPDPRWLAMRFAGRPAASVSIPPSVLGHPDRRCHAPQAYSQRGVPGLAQDNANAGRVASRPQQVVHGDR